MSVSVSLYSMHLLKVSVKVKKAVAPREIQHHIKGMGCHITTTKIVQRISLCVVLL